MTTYNAGEEDKWVAYKPEFMASMEFNDLLSSRTALFSE